MIVLELESVTAWYGTGGASHPAVHDIGLAVEPGEVVALVGPNGAGKSTVLRVAGGVLRPVTGAVRLAGEPIRNLSARQVSQQIATVPQDPVYPPGMLGREMVGLGRTPYRGWFSGWSQEDQRAVDRALDQAEAGSLADRFVHELSGGERQRLLLAKALAQEPRVLLLDEPTANLDLHHQVAALEAVRSLARIEGLAVVAAVHDLQLAALYADRLVLLCGGAVVGQGTPEVILTEKLLSPTFEQAVALAPHPTHGVPLVAVVPNGHARRLPPTV